MATTLMSAAAVQAREPDPVRDTGPATIVVTAKSARPNHFNSSIKVDVPAGGNALIGSPSVPKDMTVANVEVGAPLSDNVAFKKMAMILLPLGVKTKTQKVDGQFHITSDGPLTIKRKNSKLKVRWVARASKYIYTVKPRKKGKTLKSVVGKFLQVGIASPAGAEAGAEVKVAFKAP